jgi:reactive intermediate/imine deaminase
MKPIHSKEAPDAIGPYSQAVQVGKTVYLSGQIALNPENGELIKGGIEPQARQVFQNLSAVINASGGTLAQVVKLNIYMIDLDEFAIVNAIMEQFFKAPYPARATIGVQALPRQAQVEVDAILQLD